MEKTLHGKEAGWYKNAFRFAKNAGRKSSKRKIVKKALANYNTGNKNEKETKEIIKLTKPWQASGPINN